MSKTDETVKEPEKEKPVPAAEPQQHATHKHQVDVAAPERVFLVPYPKVVFLYPTFLCGLFAALWMTVHGSLDGKTPVVLAAVFLTTVAVNLIVLTLDFPRATSLTLFFIAATIFLGVMLVAILRPQVLPFLRDLVAQVRPLANATFYWLVTGIIGVIFLIVKVKIQFNYWEVRRNELLHHHGILSDLSRYPTSGLQINKEISDVFEYCLLRSGRLTLKPQGESRVFVLENVPRISAKEAKLTHMLGALKVKVQAED